MTTYNKTSIMFQGLPYHAIGGRLIRKDNIQQDKHYALSADDLAEDATGMNGT